MAIAQFSRTTNYPKWQAQTCQYVSQNSARVLENGNWVSLFALPSEYAHYEALLLCRVDGDRWVTWIPDCGEVELCLR